MKELGTRDFSAARRYLPACASAWMVLTIPHLGAVADPNSSDVPSISGAHVRAHVEFLADDLMEGREAGTRGIEQFSQLKTVYVDYSGTLQKAQIDTHPSD